MEIFEHRPIRKTAEMMEQAAPEKKPLIPKGRAGDPAAQADHRLDQGRGTDFLVEAEAKRSGGGGRGLQQLNPMMQPSKNSFNERLSPS